MASDQSTPGPSGQLFGSVDGFYAPGTFAGWVKNSELLGRGRDITVSIYRGDRLLAEGPLTGVRTDIVDDEDYLSGFRLTCKERIPDEQVAFARLRIEARDQDGRSCRMEIWDPVRSLAVTRLMQTSAPLEELAAAAVLMSLAKNRKLTKEARQAILQVHGLHFRESYESFFQEDNQRLMYRFESLGHDCSLGSIQRVCGAEPLGLLRFTGVHIDAVLAALQDRFRGVGDPEFTTLVANDKGEYYSYDTRYHMAAHTFVFKDDVKYDRFYPQQCKRIAFLARNIMEKLADGDKIFVIHAMPEAIPDWKLHELLKVMQSLGSARLLYMQTPSESCPAGTLTLRDDGIMAGYAPYIHEIELTDERRDLWVTVCRKAEAMMLGASR